MVYLDCGSTGDNSPQTIESFGFHCNLGLSVTQELGAKCDAGIFSHHGMNTGIMPDTEAELSMC